MKSPKLFLDLALFLASFAILAGCGGGGNIAPTPLINTIAGTGIIGYSGDGGAATSAQLCHPLGVAVDAAGSIYIADSENHRIRKVDMASGIITTIAGGGFGGDGEATSAKLLFPTGVEVDSAGNIYIAEFTGHRIRKVNSAGIISTIAGTGTTGDGGDGGAAINAQLNNPSDVTIDSAGNVYIADQKSRYNRHNHHPGRNRDRRLQRRWRSGNRRSIEQSDRNSGQCDGDCLYRRSL